MDLKINDDGLNNSLSLLCEGSKTIWDPSAPRIIKDFTDHGPEHNKRLKDFAQKLLHKNNGKPLSEKEMYLLLAGICLHDIGMQCDVIRFPEIKKIAERMGAVFDVEFKAKTANDYNIDEQNAIRRNHQYLTAAWIKYAKKTGETAIGIAAKTIPDFLIGDLMDICKYHSKLPISDCPYSFQIDPNERKQLLAALLRFCDELDVDSRRVQFDIIKNFRLRPINSVFWWLHNRTNISIDDHQNIISIYVILHPDDMRLYENIIYKIAIEDFNTKNQPNISILRQHGISLAIDLNSRVKENDNVEKLPNDIVMALESMQKIRGPVNELSDEVKTWLQAIHYEVSEPIDKDSRTVDILATSQGPEYVQIIVRCIGGEIEESDVENLGKELNLETPRGWLISDTRVSPEARKKVTDNKYMQVFNLIEFLQQKIWGSYFGLITTMIEKENIKDWYVDLACYKQEIAEEDLKLARRSGYPSLDDYIDNWLKERGSLHISLLGDFGSGKTWFCRHYAYRQLERYLKNPINERLPLLITLRYFTKAMTAEQLINDALLEQYKLPFIGSAYEIFQEMNRNGKLVLILDGFDEMARLVDLQTVVDNFWELAKLVHRNSKVILTCRTEYFRWAKESEKILGGEEYGRSTIVLSPPKFEVTYLEPLNDEMIRNIIRLRKGKTEGTKVADRILAEPNLAEMARKPVLVELLLAALEEGKANVLEKPAQVYLYATEKLLLRNIREERTFTSTKDKLYFLGELAWKMIESGELNIHYRAITELIYDYFKDKIKGGKELDHWDYDLRAQALLHRNSLGYYSFSHKSMAEYFVALKFAAELGCLDPTFIETYREKDDKSCEIPFKQKDILSQGSTFGKLSLRSPNMITIRKLLHEMMSDDAPARLWRMIDETSGRDTKDVGFCAANAATILQDLGLWRPTSSRYWEVRDLVEGMQIQPESFFPPRPASLGKIEGNLNNLDSSKKGYNKAILAYKSARECKLDLASHYAIESNEENPNFKMFSLSIHAFAGLQSLYLSKFKDAETYLDEYLKKGGNPLWYHLKMGLVRLQQGDVNEARTEANRVLEGVDDFNCNIKENLEIMGILTQDKDACRRYLSVLKGRAILLIGILDRAEIDYEKSIENCREALQIFEKENDIYHQGVVLANIGIAYRMMGEFKLAVDAYDAAFKIFEDINDPYRMACVQARRGTGHRMLKEYEKAIDDYKAAIRIFNDYGDNLRKGIVLRELGTTYLILGAWDGAIANYTEALNVFQSIMDSFPELESRMGLTLYSIGLTYMMQGKWKEAIHQFDKSLKIFNDVGDNHNLILAYSGIGIAYRMLDIPKLALNNLNKALEIIRRLKDRNKESLILMKIGAAYRQKHQHQLSIECYTKSLDIVRDLTGSTLMQEINKNNLDLFLRKGRILGEIGASYRRMNKINEAIPYYENAIDTFKELGDQVGVSWILEELGQIYVMQGLISKAIDEYQEAVEALRKTECGLVDMDLINLAEGHIMRSMFKGGIEHFEAALGDIERLGNLALRAKTLRNLGEACRRIGEFDGALSRLKESLEISRGINDHDQQGRTLCYIGITHSSLAYSNLIQTEAPAMRYIHYELAALNLNEAIKKFEDIGDNFLEGWALENLGKNYIMQELWNESIETNNKAIKLNYNTGFIHLSLAICHKNCSEIEKYKEEIKIARNLIDVKDISDYDLACLEANCGSAHRQKAFNLLKSAMKKSQANVSLILREPYFKEISEDPNFIGLISEFAGYTDLIIQPFM